MFSMSPVSRTPVSEASSHQVREVLHKALQVVSCDLSEAGPMVVASSDYNRVIIRYGTGFSKKNKLETYYMNFNVKNQDNELP